LSRLTMMTATLSTLDSADAGQARAALS